MTAPAELGIVTVTIDGFTLYYRIPGGPAPTDADGVEWTVTKVTGWGGPEARTRRSPRPLGQHGSFRGEPSREERIVGLDFAVSTPYTAPQMMPALERRIAAMCSGTRLHTLTVHDPWFGPLTADVELDGEILPNWRSNWTTEFSAQFAAPDPRLHGPWVQSETPLPEPATGGINAAAPGIDATAPGIAAGVPGSPGTVRAVNGGTEAAFPVLELVGPMPSATATVLETGLRLDYSGEIPIGQSVWLNTDTFAALNLPPRSVLYGAQSSRRRLLSIPQGWPEVPPKGFVTFQLSSPTYDPAARLRIWTRDAWW